VRAVDLDGQTERPALRARHRKRGVALGSHAGELVSDIDGSRNVTSSSAGALRRKATGGQRAAVAVRGRGCALCILREIHASHRSHIYLATDVETGTPVAVKIPSLDLRSDPAYLRRFAFEEWVARRVQSPYVLAPAGARRERSFLYNVTEHVEAQTLRQWMLDNPNPSLETVRSVRSSAPSSTRRPSIFSACRRAIRPLLARGHRI